MKIKNIDLINITNTLSKFNNHKLPQKINYAIVKNLRTLDKELEVYQSLLSKLLEEYESYTLKDDNGETKYYDNGLPMVDKEHEAQLYNEVNELLDVDINVDFYQIPEESFNYEENDRYDVLSSQDIINLQTILCDLKEDDGDEKAN